MRQGHQGECAATRQIEGEARQFSILIHRLVRRQLPAPPERRSLVADGHALRAILLDV